MNARHEAAWGERIDDLFVVTLCTPWSRINVLNAAMASAIEHLVSHPPPGTRAIVFRSGKPGSFLNGVGLLLASSVDEPDRVAKLVAPIRRTYDAVRDAPVPTVAAVDGTCFGCGVEFSLQCTRRVAPDSYDTRFYMTELADYRMLPAFGATVDLPRAVGLAHAVESLLWGRTWWGRQAHEIGLIDVLHPARDLAGWRPAVEEALARPARPEPAHPVPMHLDAVTDRIAALPPMDRPLYRTALELLQRAADGGPDRTLRDAELTACSESVVGPWSRAAQAVFFVRRAAEAALGAAPGSSLGRPTPIALAEPVASFVAARRLARVEVTRGPSLVEAPFDLQEIPIVLSPEPSDVLSRAGLTVLPSGGLDRWLQAWSAALARLDARGVGPGAVAASLRRFGFWRVPLDLERALRPALRSGVPVAAPAGHGHPDAALAVCGALLAEALRARPAVHPAISDLIAREVFDFPIGLGTLCRWGTPARAGEVASSRAARWLSVDDIRVLRRHAAEGQPIYLGAQWAA